jgi:hypothetical protein
VRIGATKIKNIKMETTSKYFVNLVAVIKNSGSKADISQNNNEIY